MKKLKHSKIGITSFIMSLAGFILGFVSIFQKNTRKILPVIGIMMSSLILLIVILASIEVLTNNSDSIVTGEFIPKIQIANYNFSLSKTTKL